MPEGLQLLGVPSHKSQSGACNQMNTLQAAAGDEFHLCLALECASDATTTAAAEHIVTASPVTNVTRSLPAASPCSKK